MRRILIGIVLMMATVGAFAAGLPAAGKPTHSASVFYSTLNYRTGHSVIGYANVGLGQIYCTESPFGNAEFKIALDNLADGAMIKKVSVWYYDFDATNDLHFSLGRATVGLMDVVDGVAEVTSATQTWNNDPEALPALQVAELAPTSPVVLDNANSQYFISAAFDACGTVVGDEGTQFPGLVLDGARVEYTTT